MASIEYLHACDYAFLGQNAKGCLIGIFSNIFVADVPATHPLMALALQVRGQPNEQVTLDISILKPNGQQLVGGPAQLALGEEGGAFVAVLLVQTVFPEIGKYPIVVKSGENVLAKSALLVRPVAEAPTKG